MKLRFSQIQINQISIALFRLKLFFLILLFLLPFHLFAQSQTATLEPEAPATAKVAIAPTDASSKSTVPESKVIAASSEKDSLLITEDLIHSGDTIDVDVLGSLEYDWRGKTDDEGFLSSLPYLDVSVLALCRTEDEVAAEVAAAYSKIIRNPQVVVRVFDRSARQPAILLGAVDVSQRFRIQRPVQLDELIIMAGGITDTASGEINIFRPAQISCIGRNQNQAKSQLIKIKLSDLLSGNSEANPQVKTGDIITVEKAPPVFVTGGPATAPQRVLFRPELTVSRAIAMAGVAGRNTDQTKIIIYRRSKETSRLEIIETDLEKIVAQKANDVLLQAYDIIEVTQPEKTYSLHAPIINAAESTQFDVNKLPVRLVD